MGALRSVSGLDLNPDIKDVYIQLRRAVVGVV